MRSFLIIAASIWMASFAWYTLTSLSALRADLTALQEKQAENEHSLHVRIWCLENPGSTLDSCPD